MSPGPGAHAKPLRSSNMTPVVLATPAAHARQAATTQADNTRPWHARNHRHTQRPSSAHKCAQGVLTNSYIPYITHTTHSLTHTRTSAPSFRRPCCRWQARRKRRSRPLDAAALQRPGGGSPRPGAVPHAAFSAACRAACGHSSFLPSPSPLSTLLPVPARQIGGTCVPRTCVTGCHTEAAAG